ncbi:hypothetical protein HJC99_06260 [Candidatus Saccharibacteria bacterium]|nr:hypothetical protein [Candidatus Saccharibacteria bacterium]
MSRTLSQRTSNPDSRVASIIPHLNEVEGMLEALVKAGAISEAAATDHERRAYIFIPPATNYATLTSMMFETIIGEYYLGIECRANGGHRYPKSFRPSGNARADRRFVVVEKCTLCSTERTSKRQQPNVFRVMSATFDRTAVYDMTGDPTALKPTEWRVIWAAADVIITLRGLMAANNLTLRQTRRRLAVS